LFFISEPTGTVNPQGSVSPADQTSIEGPKDAIQAELDKRPISVQKWEQAKKLNANYEAATDPIQKEAYRQQILNLANPPKVKEPRALTLYDEATMAAEGYENKVYTDNGAPAIGYGHRLTNKEQLTGEIMVNGNPINYKDGGFTKEIATEKYKEDIAKSENKVSKSWAGFDSLSPLDKQVITELGFNTKKPVTKANWPELYKSMQMSPGPRRTDRILQEIMRTYEEKDGTKVHLINRVTKLRQAYRAQENT